MVLYVAAQLLGASLAGLLLRAAADTRDFKVGGCFLFEDLCPVSSAFTVEVVGDFILLVLAFGVGLDPRQLEIFGPANSAVLVGLSVGTTALSLSFSRPGFGGASGNPARCFGAFVGSRFPHWHWIHWVGPLAASVVHGVLYFLVPPVSLKDNDVASRLPDEAESTKIPKHSV
jgi:glycerol uptake facilitator-like aquaporin